MKFRFILFILITIILILPICGGAQISQTETLRKELKELQKQLDETKKLYEEKILQLETKISNLEQQLQSSEPAQSNFFSGMSSSTAYLPDISFIGNIIGSFGDTQDNKVYLDSVEFAFGGYIFPNARADAILGIHRHENHYETELEEGYISFFNLPGNFGFQAGKKLLDFGKINQIHEHHYLFVDKPLAVEAYLGEHGVIGNGVSINYLFPLSFFLQGSVGYWVLEDHKEEGEEESFAPTDNAFNARLWSSFAVSAATEVEIGASYLKAKGPCHSDSPRDVDDINLYGLDITLKHQGYGFRRLLFRNEFYFLQRDRFKPGEIDEEWWRKGLYSLLDYRFNQYWEAGMRYDLFESPGMEKETEQVYSIFLTRSLTETTKFRGQISYHTEENDWRFYIQTLFGIGPHSHPLE
ncbi:MAG: FlxA-like family protein [Candidatus Omnitrophica bacterium]|nr:FlxA-like family protein [Candidatus Omnitrophota bacterium]